MSSLPQPESPLAATPADPEVAKSSPSIEFVTLFLAEQRRLHRYIVTLLSGQQDADDLLQETAALLWRKFDEFRPGTSFYSWGCKAAYLLVLEFRRRQGRDAILLDDDVLERLAAISERSDALPEVQITALQHCLDKLAIKDRQLIERCYSVKIKAKDVAAELGRPEKSIYRSLGRIRRMLLECVRRFIASTEREGSSQ